jgi:hypothetical protein
MIIFQYLIQNHQSSANVYEYYYKYMGTFGLYEYQLLPQWKKDLKVKIIIIISCLQ